MADAEATQAESAEYKYTGSSGLLMLFCICAALLSALKAWMGSYLDLCFGLPVYAMGLWLVMAERRRGTRLKLGPSGLEVIERGASTMTPYIDLEVVRKPLGLTYTITAGSRAMSFFGFGRSSEFVRQVEAARATHVTRRVASPSAE